MIEVGNIGERTTAGSGCSRTPAFTVARGGGYRDENVVGAADKLASIDLSDRAMVCEVDRALAPGAGVVCIDADEDGARMIGELVRHVLSRLRFDLERINRGNPLTDPAHHRNSHGVAQHLVARAISHHPGPIWNQREVIGESLEAFALAWGQAADSRSILDRVMASAIGMTILVTHAAKGGHYLTDAEAVLPRRFAVESDRQKMPGSCTFGTAAGASGKTVFADGANNRNQRRPAASAIFRRVKAFAAKRVRDHGLGLGLVILPTHPASVQAVTYGWDVGLTVGAVAAVALSAECRADGNVFPRLSARRRMPRQAVALKKNCGGTSPVSKISDNEDATAALWNSEVLSVENAVGEPIPEFAHPSEDGSKCPSSVNGQDAGDVLPYQPSGPCAISKAEIFERQVATLVIQSASKAGDAERLAGGASDKKVNWSIFIASDLGEVADQRDIGIMVGQHGAWGGFDFSIAKRLPAQRLPCGGWGGYAAAYVDVTHDLLAPHRSQPSGDEIGMVTQDAATGFADRDFGRASARHIGQVVRLMFGDATMAAFSVERLTKRLQFGEGGIHLAHHPFHDCADGAEKQADDRRWHHEQKSKEDQQAADVRAGDGFDAHAAPSSLCVTVRSGRPKESSKAIVFLHSPLSSSIQTVPVLSSEAIS